MRKPLYRQVADGLRSEIDAGVYPPGASLPSERELSIRFDAARNTVRQGLNVLVTEGLIAPSQGRGYEVRSHDLFTLDASRFENLTLGEDQDGDAYSDEVRRAGRRPHQEFRVELQPASDEVAARLSVDVTSSTILRFCLRYVDGVPWSTQATHYPAWVVSEAPRIAEPQDIDEGTTRYLNGLGLEQMRYHDTWSTRMPTPTEARELQVGPGVPVLIWSRTGFTSAGRAIRSTVTTFRGDLNQVTYDIDTRHTPPGGDAQ
ncbi:GntR family transcriptional regulator [Kitasatospora sp. NPDC087861]|uniref:GntR family transcriptional regulator n=1 Tax=Kitasatospora sp. NPDC087861 TaxID=3364070 RepID=UPI0037F222EC